jgi:hypothetical protein
MSGNAHDLLSGVWAGYYMQGGARHPQQATLEFADGLIRGDGRDGVGLFSIAGEYRAEPEGVRMGWIKTYDGAHSVLYLGVLVGPELRGQWQLSGMTDTFALSPEVLGRSGALT